MAIQIKKALIPVWVSAPLLDELSIAQFCQQSSINFIFDVLNERISAFNYNFEYFAVSHFIFLN